MLKNHWYAVEFGVAVDLKPHKIRVFGQDLLLYRDCLGALVCHSDACVCCGDSLSAGAVAGDRIRCATCGREYDLDGVCTLAPDLGPGVAIPVWARVDSYPSVEQYGYIFLFLGDLPGNRRPPGPRLPILDVMPYAQAHEHRMLTGETSWSANYEHVIENTLDVERVRALHAADDANREAPVSPLPPDPFADPDFVDLTVNGFDITTKFDDYELHESHVGLWLTGVTGEVSLDAPEATGLRKLTVARAEVVPTRVGVFFPNLTVVDTPVPGGMLRIFTAVVPVDDSHSISKWTMARTFSTSPLGDSAARRRMRRIIDADRPVIEAADPGAMSYHPDAHLDTRRDSLRDAYRSWRQTVLSWGWGIEQAPDDGFDHWTETRVIPSPARRFPPESPESWVLGELGAIEVRREA